MLSALADNTREGCDPCTFLGTLLMDICRSSSFLAAVAFSGVP